MENNEQPKMLSQGQEVITKSGKIRAVITGACIRGGNISYELSYFDTNDYKQCWVYSFEFDVDDAEKSNPGFKPADQILLNP